MFDFSLYEIIVFGIIALIVLGPEKLPQAVRTAGIYYAKFRRTVGTIKAEMEAELDLAETRQKMQEELAKIKQAELEMQQEMARLKGSVEQMKRQSALKDTSLDSPTFTEPTSSMSTSSSQPSLSVALPKNGVLSDSGEAAVQSMAATSTPAKKTSNEAAS